METSIDLYSIAQDIKSSHSGRGNSWWEIGANCGYARELTNIHGGEDHSHKDWAIRGVYLHLLQQWWHDGRVSEDTEIELRDDDALWNEAVTLHSWFKQLYGQNFWGEVLGTEVQVPASDEDRTKVAQYFGVPEDYAPTGRYDMLVRTSDEDVERMANSGILLPGAGLYIVDWKHGGRHNFDDEMKYTYGPQPTLYMTLGSMLLSEPVRGMIFVKGSMTMEKGKLKFKESTFRTYVALNQPDTKLRAKSMIANAYKSVVDKQKNGYACLGCPFFLKQCQGY
jgi:hypothetical protein